MFKHRSQTRTAVKPGQPWTHHHTTTIDTPRRSRAAIVAVAALLALLALLAVTATASAAQWQSYDVDADDYYDVSGIDRNGNDTFDAVWFDVDDDGRWDTQMYNTRYGDGLLEVVEFDMNENGEAEARMLDGDQRVGFDYLLVDRDENGYWDGPRRIIPGSNIDAVTRSNRQNVSRDQMYLFRMRTGMSLLYPTFPACC